jgi:mannose-1-phosphate guanylyltransferase
VCWDAAGISEGEIMKAVILVGGRATRLLPLTAKTPKAMVPVVNVPFLEHVIARLSQHGVDEIVLAQGHLAGPIESYLGDGRRFGLKIHYSLEDKPLGTAGAIKQAEKYVDGQFVVLNGDIFDDLDITGMTEFHRSRGALATIALTPVEDPTAYGLVEADKDGRVTRFLEKPAREQITTNMINAGTYVLDTALLKQIPAATNVSIEREVFPRLLAEGRLVYAFASPGYWIDLGTPEKYALLHRDLMSGKCRGYTLPDGKLVFGERCAIDPSAVISGPVVIGAGCSVGARAVIRGPVVVGERAAIGADCLIQDAVIWRNAHLAPGSTVSRSILADDCRLEAGCLVEGAVLGDGVVVSRGARVPPGSRIEPGTRV